MARLHPDEDFAFVVQIPLLTKNVNTD